MSMNSDYKQMAVVTGTPSGIGLGIAGAQLRGKSHDPTEALSKNQTATHSTKERNV
jgi:hypothetical protein